MMKRLLIFLFCAFFAFCGVKAQNVLWNPGYPRIHNPVIGDNTIIIYDTAYLEVSFALQSPATDMGITITPPSGVTLVSSEPEVLPGNTLSYSGILTAGTRYRIGNVENSDWVHFRIPVTTANCDIANDIVLKIQLDNNSVNIPATSNGQKDVILSFEKPILNVYVPEMNPYNGTLPNRIQELNDEGDEREYFVALQCTYGIINNFSVALRAYSPQVRLTDFTLNGYPIPSGNIRFAGTVANGDSVYNVDITRRLMLDAGITKGKLTAAEVYLSVKAQTKTPCGIKTVGISGWLPYASTTNMNNFTTISCANTGTLPVTFTLQMEESFAPRFIAIPSNHLHFQELDPAKGPYTFSNTAAATYEQHFTSSTYMGRDWVLDGVTTNYATSCYINTSVDSALITNMRLTVTASASENRGTTYIDTANVYYSLGYAKPRKKVENISIVWRMSQISVENPAYANYPLAINCSIPEWVNGGDTVFFYIPFKAGMFYDTLTNSLPNQYFTFIRTEIMNSRNYCGDQGTVNYNSYSYIQTPMMPLKPENIAVKANRRGTARVLDMRSYDFGHNHNDITYHNIPGKPQMLEVFVQFPSWMTLDSTQIASLPPIRWVQASDETNHWRQKTGTPVPNTYRVIQHNDSTFSIRVLSKDNDYITWEVRGEYNSGTLLVDYKTGNCPTATENIMAQIKYWIDWHSNGTEPATSARPVFKRIAYQTQNVEMLCKEDGFVLDDFSIYRQNRGLRDTNNDNIPDGTGLALDEEIDHTLYYNKDNGYFIWKGHLAGTSSNTYTNLYTPLSIVNSGTNIYFTTDYASLNNHILLLKDSASIKINGMEQAADFYLPSSNEATRFYSLYTGSLKGGDLVEIRIPFYCVAGVNNIYQNATIKGEAYVRNTLHGNGLPPDQWAGGGVFLSADEDSQRHGEDYFTSSMKIRELLYNYMAMDAFTLTHNLPSSNLDYWFQYRWNERYLIPPYFTKEVRQDHVPDTFQVELPEGYAFESGRVRLGFIYRTSDGQLYYQNTTSLEADYWDEIRLMIDCKRFFDLNYDGTEVGTGAASALLPSGKFRLPSEAIRIMVYADYRATKGAPQTIVRLPQISQSNLDLRDGKTLTASASANANNSKPITYTGEATSLSLSTYNVNTSTSVLEIPVVNIGNPNMNAINNTWLYVEGNVKNLALDGSPGEGYEGRWLFVENVLNSGVISQKRLAFTYSGNQCLDTVTVYVVSGYGTSWDPRTDPLSGVGAPAGAAINHPWFRKDYAHEGAKKRFTITAVSAAVDGTLLATNENLSLPSGTVKYDEPQILTVEVNSFGASGAVRGQMKVDIPSGLKYRAGSARIAYPANNPQPVHADYENYLLSTLANEATLSATRYFDYSPGKALGDSTRSISAIGSGNERAAVLTLVLVPECDVPTTGYRYNGTLSGGNVCGQQALGTGKVVYSDYQFPAISGGYNYVSRPVITGNSVVSQKDTVIKIDVIVTKSEGPGNPISSNDSLVLTMHPAFNIEKLSYPSAYGTYTAPQIMRNYIDGGLRYVVMTLPVAYLNNLPSYGVNVPIENRFELSYTPSMYNIADGVKQNVVAYVKTRMGIAAQCPTTDMALGNCDTTLGICVFSPFPAVYCPDVMDTALVANAALFGYTDFLFNFYDAPSTAAVMVTAGSVAIFNTQHQPIDTLYVQVTENIPPYRDLGWLHFIYETLPVVDANFKADMACLNKPYTFEDSTTVGGVLSGIAYWEWSAPDAEAPNTSTAQNPQFTFTAEGSYPVTLIVTSVNGCTDTVKKNITVRPQYTISCPANVLATLKYGQCDTAIVLGMPVLSSPADAYVQVSNNGKAVYGQGVHRVTWYVTDTWCSVVDSCEQLVVVNPPPCGENDTVWDVNGNQSIRTDMYTTTDADGHVYNTVRIGCDCWTKENMKTSTYSSAVGGGSVDYKIYESAQYPNTASNASTFGYLYTYAAATKGNTVQGICPDGWKLPSETNYRNLEQYNSIELKQTGPNFWLGETVTNSTGFSAVPAGYHDGLIGASNKIMGDTWFWISDPATTTTGKACHLYFNCPDGFIVNMNTAHGLSVRCIKVAE
jgi:uncharacterized protein (TIGR02145 family)